MYPEERKRDVKSFFSLPSASFQTRVISTRYCANRWPTTIKVSSGQAKPGNEITRKTLCCIPLAREKTSVTHWHIIIFPICHMSPFSYLLRARKNSPARGEKKAVLYPLICLSYPLPVLMPDTDISFTPPLTDGSPLVDSIPPFLMIRNFPQEAATYPVSPDASDLIDFLSRWWKYLLSILAIRLERRPARPPFSPIYRYLAEL